MREKKDERMEQEKRIRERKSPDGICVRMYIGTTDRSSFLLILEREVKAVAKNTNRLNKRNQESNQLT